MMTKISFTDPAWSDYLDWQNNDRKTLKRINDLIKSISRDPYSGLGKPERLRGNLSDFWSRRIDLANRIVYQVKENETVIISCRYHYDDH